MANAGNVDALLAQVATSLTNTSSNTAAGTEVETVVQQMEQLTAQLAQLQTVNQAALESVRAGIDTADTKAAPSTTGGSASGSSGGSVLGTVLSSFGTGLGLSPLISGIASLFGGGGGSSAPPPLVKFALPGTESVNAGVGGGVAGAFGTDYAQGGLVRPVTNSSSAAPQQITVQVQAMDSQSFLDRSSDIAAAVRQAMLESGVLNDVVREA